MSEEEQELFDKYVNAMQKIATIVGVKVGESVFDSVGKIREAFKYGHRK